MIWSKVLLVLLGAALVYFLVRFVLAFRRFQRRFDDFSAEAGQRLLEHTERIDSTLERWHEYDEAYQEAVARLEEEAGGEPQQPGRGATLGPSGGSFRKPN
ncbi:MAG: hypothetical protein ACE5G6_01540 [Terriglobia bacterium]